MSSTWQRFLDSFQGKARAKARGAPAKRNSTRPRPSCDAACHVKLFHGKLDNACLAMCGIPRVGCSGALFITGTGGSGTQSTARELQRRLPFSRGVHWQNHSARPQEVLVSWFSRTSIEDLRSEGRSKSAGSRRSSSSSTSTSSSPVLGRAIHGVEAREWPGELSYAAHLSRCLYRVVIVQLRHPLRAVASLLLFTRDDFALRSFRKADALLRHSQSLLQRRPGSRRQQPLPPRRQLPSVHRLSQALLHPLVTGGTAERAAHQARLAYLTAHWHAWNAVAIAAADDYYRVEDGVDYARLCRLAQLPCQAPADGDERLPQSLRGGEGRGAAHRGSSHDAATTHGGAHHNLTWEALRAADPTATAKAKQLAERVGYHQQM